MPQLQVKEPQRRVARARVWKADYLVWLGKPRRYAPLANSEAQSQSGSPNTKPA